IAATAKFSSDAALIWMALSVLSAIRCKYLSCWVRWFIKHRTTLLLKMTVEIYGGASFTVWTKTWKPQYFRSLDDLLWNKPSDISQHQDISKAVCIMLTIHHGVPKLHKIDSPSLLVFVAPSRLFTRFIEFCK